MDIETTTDGGVTTLAFARPGKKNAITAAMYTALADALGAAREDRTVRAVVLAGSSSCFTAGNDLQDFLANPPAGDDSPVFRFLHAISTFPKVIVAAPCGIVVGVGTTMLLHCDLIYCGDNARFSTPFTALGLVPEAASSLLLPMLAGGPRAAEALLLGEAFDASHALQMGLVNRVLPAAEALPYAQAQAARVAALPPTAVRESKRLMRSGMADAVRLRMADEGEVFSRMLRSPEAREAFTAFMQKRKPDFSQFG